MTIRLRGNAEPFSARAQPGRTQIRPHLAQSQGARLLTQELRRYCNGEVRGRSFLLAGHRGSGKTTMVDEALLKLQEQAHAGTLLMKPLPVYLLGPTLLEEERSTEASAPPSPPASTCGPTSVTVNVAGESISVPAPPPPPDDDELMHRVLIQVVLALHQAVSKQFVDRFHELARAPFAEPELCEMAAQFQIELTEAPPPSRLREFWSLAGALELGLLFDAQHMDATRRQYQGLRELVALTGVTHAHQRVSGELKEQDDQRSGRSRTREIEARTGSKGSELLKPVVAVASGAAVATASAASGAPFAAIVLGLLTALGAGVLFRMSTSTSDKRERQVDRTFIPDLSIKTLHRLLPSLVERLQDAGLAPVFVIDELDKVDDLERRIYPLIRNLKKLFAERSFTCLLVDRGFYENLLIREELERIPSPNWRSQRPRRPTRFRVFRPLTLKPRGPAP
jgi:hypothetical protein